MTLDQLLRDAGVELDRQARAQEHVAQRESPIPARHPRALPAALAGNTVSLTSTTAYRQGVSRLMRGAVTIVLLIGSGATFWLITGYRNDQSSGGEQQASRTDVPAGTPTTDATVQSTVPGGVNAFADFFFPEDGASEHARLQPEIAQSIVACMRDRGFEFPVVPPSAADAATSPSTLHGYGIVDEMTITRAAAAPLFAESSSEPLENSYLITLTPDERIRFLEALDEYLFTLTPDERVRFFETLDLQPPATNGQPPFDGCLAQGLLQGQAAAQADMPRFNPLYRDILDDYYVGLSADLPPLERAWGECVEDRTHLLSDTGSTLQLSRENIRVAVFADIAARLGRSVRSITETEARTLDATTLTPPVDLVADEKTGVGYLVWGPPTRLDPDTVDSAVQRELVVRAADEDCWIEVGGESRLQELRDTAMQQVALVTPP